MGFQNSEIFFTVLMVLILIDRLRREKAKAAPLEGYGLCVSWCRRPESNRHARSATVFETVMSTNSITSANQLIFTCVETDASSFPIILQVQLSISLYRRCQEFRAVVMEDDMLGP